MNSKLQRDIEKLKYKFQASVWTTQVPKRGIWIKADIKHTFQNVFALHLLMINISKAMRFGLAPKLYCQAPTHLSTSTQVN